MPTASEDPTFRPPREHWIGVSPRLGTARRIVLAAIVAPILAASVLLAVIWHPAMWALVAVCVVAFLCGWWLIGRRVRSFGYAERADDLVVTSGIMFRRLVIVPYGRMQLVDLTAGPLDRRFGLTTVQLHTAAATSNASIPGLEPSVASDLRDRLARRGEGRSSGL